MKNNVLLVLIIITYIMPLHAISWLLDQKITLFSISYKNDDENDSEDGDLKIKVLYYPLYDEKAHKESVKKIKLLEEEIKKNSQKKEMIEQQKKVMQQQEIEIEELIKEADLNIKRKQIALRKLLATV